MGEEATAARIGTFSVHGITRHEPLRMMDDVSDGIARWLSRSTNASWRRRFQDPVVGRRRPRALPRIVIESEDPDAPAICVTESAWSDLLKDGFRPYTVRQWVANMIASAGEATRALNRKTEIELLFSAAPIAASLILGFVVFALVADTALRGGVAVLPLLTLGAFALVDFVRSLAAPFIPLARRRIRLLVEELRRYAGLPAAARYATAVHESFIAAGETSDPSNAILVMLSLARGTLWTALWLLVATLYAALVLGPVGRSELSRLTPADIGAFVVIALAVRLRRAAVRRIRLLYEPLEDIYAYADPSRAARTARHAIVRRVTADLESFLASADLDHIVVTGHSLGSVLVLDALAETLRDVQCGRFDARHLERVRAVVLYGSPLAKIVAQVRALNPADFTTELIRLRIILDEFAAVKAENGAAVCHNCYYLTDIVADKFVSDDDSVQNYLLPAPWRPWSHGAYHSDDRFWSIVFDAAGLTETLSSVRAGAAPRIGAADAAVPSRWPAPTTRQVVLGFTKLGIVMLTWLFAAMALAHGADANLAMVVMTVSVTVMVLTVRD